MQLKTHTSGKPSSADAEALAVAALSFLVADTRRLGAFLAETGLGPENMRAAARSPGFMAAILDYLIGNETILLEFADVQGLDPARIVAARGALPGVRNDS